MYQSVILLQCYCPKATDTFERKTTKRNKKRVDYHQPLYMLLFFLFPECTSERDSWNVSDNPQTKTQSKHRQERLPDQSHTHRGSSPLRTVPRTSQPSCLFQPPPTNVTCSLSYSTPLTTCVNSPFSISTIAFIQWRLPTTEDMNLGIWSTAFLLWGTMFLEVHEIRNLKQIVG